MEILAKPGHGLVTLEDGKQYLWSRISNAEIHEEPTVQRTVEVGGVIYYCVGEASGDWRKP